MDLLRNQVNYASLSLRDLLEAREQYHVHLLNKQNVVGTAVGLYLIRDSDPWPDARHPYEQRQLSRKAPRTFGNSGVRPYSWPCVIVMVDQWVEEEAFGGPLHPQDMVPKSLYLPDGRIIPVCVVQVEPAAPAPRRLADWIWPEAPIGGGFPLVVRSQGLQRNATVGCLVTDGHTIYALTNRHVCGAPGQPVCARLRGADVEVGQASALQLTRMLFNEVYASLPGSHTYLNLDVGLVEIADARDWTSSIYGMGAAGTLADLNEQNLGLQLIDQPVHAFGAVSGHLEGVIKALFHRYKSVGGYDYVCDLLIAPTDPGQQSRPGDSGTVWHLRQAREDQAATYHPLAVEWGAQTIDLQGNLYNFALATSLSNICKLLDVELVAEHNTAARPYWGATGHYSIGRVAVEEVRDKKLARLLQANIDRISFDRGRIEQGGLNKELNDATFVPLADVADIVWKKLPSQIKGGRDTHRDGHGRSQGPEHANHYADIDVPGPDGATLRELCMKDPANVDVEVWRAFYDSIGYTAPDKRGLLPFRVWQFYDAMVALAKKKDYAGYVAAAGLVAHYVGDACQPLHGSYLADGYEDQAVEGTTRTGNPKWDWPGKGVHSAYETKMIDAKSPQLFEQIGKLLKKSPAKLAPIESGHDAAAAIVKLMDDTAGILPPARLCDTYIELGEGASKRVLDGLWEHFGKDTARIMTLGISNLVHLWESAWAAGGGASAEASDLVGFSEADLRKRYADRKFVPSLDLDHIGSVLK